MLAAKPASAACGGFSEQGLAQRSKSVAATAAATDFGHRKSLASIEGLKKESSLDGYHPFLCSVKEMGGTIPNQ